MSLPNEPIGRTEAYLAKMAGQNVELPPYPVGRIEAYLDEIAKNGGKSYEIKDSYDTVEELEAAHPTGEAGETYLVGDPTHVYVWLVDEEEWGDAGEFTAIEGPQGDDGAPGADGKDGKDGQDGLGIKSVDINESDHLIVTYDDNTEHDAGEIPGGTVTVDDELSQSSINPVQNKVITNAISRIGGCFEKTSGTTKSVLPDTPETTDHGVTYKIKDDVFEADGTVTSGGLYFWTDLFPAGTYTITTDSISGSGVFNIGKATQKSGSPTYLFNLPSETPKTFTLAEANYLRFAAYTNAAFSKLKFRLWYNEGSKSLPYDDGIRLKEIALPDSVKELIENRVIFMSVSDFNTNSADMMNNNDINVLY